MPGAPVSSSPEADREVAALRAVVDVGRERVRGDLADGVPGGLITARFSEALRDGIRSQAWAVTRSHRGAEDGELPWGPTALLAVGSLARDELCPYGDLDLVVLTEREVSGDDAFADWMRQLLHPLWDAGLRVNAVVHQPVQWLDAAVDDLPACTALLDMALLAGDRSLVEVVAEDARNRFFGPRRANFLHRLGDARRDRHERFGGTVYRVEPDLKFGPGGTRDLATLDWSLLATHGTADLADLVRRGVVRRRSARILVRARDELLRLRAALHLAAGRAQDRLVFQYQEGIPALFGMVPADPPPADAELVAAIETFMQRYYAAAGSILRHGTRETRRCLPPQEGAQISERVDERFRLEDHRLRHYGADPFAETPALGLEAIALARDRRVFIAPHTVDCIAEAAASPAGARLVSEPAAQARFLEILVDPTDAGSPTPLALCHELGLLERLVPEFRASRGRMQHDSFHVYTVDQHSLYVVEFLKALARGDHRKDYPLATALHLGIDDPRALYVAALLHDSGKALGDQCVEGAKIARAAALRAGLGEGVAERCAALVTEHLTMPLLSQKRDLSDPLLIEAFAQKVGDRRMLAELYLLSLADMASVSPDYLTSWKATLLDELYLLTAAHMSQREHKIVLGRRHAVDEPEALPNRYYSLYDVELRRRHRRLIDQVRGGESPLIIDARRGAGGAMRLTVVSPDRPGLLAQITACLAHVGLEVLAADLFVVPGDPPVVLDIFRVLPKSELGEEVQVERDWVTNFERAMRSGYGQLGEGGEAGEDDPELLEPLPPVRRRGRRRGATTRVSFDEDPAGARSIVEIETLDQPGVLRRITRAFAALEVEVQLARLITEGQRVFDVFYVDRLDDARRTELEELIRRYLQRR